MTYILYHKFYYLLHDTCFINLILGECFGGFLWLFYLYVFIIIYYLVTYQINVFELQVWFILTFPYMFSYCKTNYDYVLFQDIDYRVRETAQQAMSTLVSKVRRNLAPYVKNIMGSWLLSQCDTYPTVSSAAKQAFQSAFPPARQQPAISYCKMEIASVSNRASV